MSCRSIQSQAGFFPKEELELMEQIDPEYVLGPIGRRLMANGTSPELTTQARQIQHAAIAPLKARAPSQTCSSASRTGTGSLRLTHSQAVPPAGPEQVERANYNIYMK
jgi:hypothetical protein